MLSNLISNKKQFLIYFILFIAVIIPTILIVDEILSKRAALEFHQTGIASWYGPGFAGRKTANGEIYNPKQMTAAHKTLPLGSVVKVINLENDKIIKVRINDRGPYVDDRIIDLSEAAAEIIGIIKKGTGKVEVIGISQPRKK